ncbi:hypothetical protein BCR34DRAFT_319639 [Clohesyomyces aquaticus]|uniref:Uncharacterized protein n=1 Tax=Clohesyomyces aquaticus TaxID=1231657 RepID=A0A1Y2A7M2_9PLEO|nr:hypothetical protein BCR34DRAFT_319639 [Clohesyomyces aquaticus]
MRVTIVALALAASVVASPFQWARAEVTGIAISPNKTNGTHHPTNASGGHHNPHKEPTPSFILSCECPKPIVPVDLLSPSERCEFEWAHKMGCYYRAQGGCPSPAPVTC